MELPERNAAPEQNALIDEWLPCDGCDVEAPFPWKMPTLGGFLCISCMGSAAAERLTVEKDPIARKQLVQMLRQFADYEERRTP